MYEVRGVSVRYRIINLGGQHFFTIQYPPQCEKHCNGATPQCSPVQTSVLLDWIAFQSRFGGFLHFSGVVTQIQIKMVGGSSSSQSSSFRQVGPWCCNPGQRRPFSPAHSSRHPKPSEMVQCFITVRTVPSFNLPPRSFERPQTRHEQRHAGLVRPSSPTGSAPSHSEPKRSVKTTSTRQKSMHIVFGTKATGFPSRFSIGVHVWQSKSCKRCFGFFDT